MPKKTLIDTKIISLIYFAKLISDKSHCYIPLLCGCWVNRFDGKLKISGPLSSTIPQFNLSVQHKRVIPFQHQKFLSSTPKPPQLNTSRISTPKILSSTRKNHQFNTTLSSTAKTPQFYTLVSSITENPSVKHKKTLC